MKNLATNIGGAFIFLVIVWTMGKFFFLSELQKKLNIATEELSKIEETNTTLEYKLQKLVKKNVKNDSATRGNFLLKSGDEVEILEKIIELSGKPMRINSFELIDSFYTKPPEDESMMDTFVQPDFSNAEMLPQLDEQGMPIGLATENDNEWLGVEIIPVRFSFSTTYRALGRFFKNANRQMPMYSVRIMDIIINNNGIVKGTFVFNFPVIEAVQ